MTNSPPLWNARRRRLPRRLAGAAAVRPLPAAAAAVDDRRRNTAAGLAASLRHTGAGTQEPLWERLGGLSIPVLVVVGERDEKFTTLGRRLVDAIGSSATFAAIGDAGHAAHLEQPAAFVAIVERWLTSR
jgi:2-succinyl-6-hydroxy-2,4-cyclohexadiene-1-carboxylate synthase